MSSYIEAGQQNVRERLGNVFPRAGVIFELVRERFTNILEMHHGSKQGRKPKRGGKREWVESPSTKRKKKIERNTGKKNKNRGDLVDGEGIESSEEQSPSGDVF